MHITLKNIKHSEAQSEDSECFSADIYIDGKYAGAVSNSGHGGANEYNPLELEQKLNEFAKTLNPYTFNGKTSLHTADTLIGYVLELNLVGKEVRSLLKSSLVYTKPNEHGLYAAHQKTGLSNEHYCKDLIAANKQSSLIGTLKADKVLNLLPFDEAVELYKRMTTSLNPTSNDQPSTNLQQ